MIKLKSKEIVKIVFLDVLTIGHLPELNILDKLGETFYYDTTSPDEIVPRIKDADIVITNKVEINKHVLAQCPSLKMICVAATGMNNIDAEAANERNILVKNVTDYSTHSVAQGTFAMILFLLHHIRYYDNYVKSGDYSRSTIFTNHDRPFWELKGKRFGIIGLGHIGRRVARIAGAFGAQVAYFSTSGNNDNKRYLRLELQELLQTSDIVSVHAPLDQKTSGLINYDKLAIMKRSAILINAGRGGIVNEYDLAKALDEDLIGGAGIDVYSREPIESQNPLLHIKHREKLVLLPHVTWASIESRTILLRKVIRHIRKFRNEMYLKHN